MSSIMSEAELNDVRKLLAKRQMPADSKGKTSQFHSPETEKQKPGKKRKNAEPEKTEPEEEAEESDEAEAEASEAEESEDVRKRKAELEPDAVPEEDKWSSATAEDAG